jgi:hypothetical protein
MHVHNIYIAVGKKQRGWIENSLRTMSKLNIYENKTHTSFRGANQLLPATLQKKFGAPASRVLLMDDGALLRRQRTHHKSLVGIVLYRLFIMRPFPISAAFCVCKSTLVHRE